jgi:peptidyl-Asp metalloendopeptidase
MACPSKKLSPQWLNALRIAGLSGFLIVIAVVPSVVAQTSSPLWELRQAPANLKPAKEAIRASEVIIDVTRLMSTDNARFSLLTPDGGTLSVAKSSQTVTPNGFVWFGKIDNEPISSVSFSVVNQTVVGSILTGRGQSFRLRRDASGVQIIEEIDLKDLPPEGQPTPVPGRRGAKEGDLAGDTCATDGPDQIDVMVVYTQDARVGAGGAAAMEADILLAVAQSNQSYLNSDITQRLRLVHTAEVAHTETGQTILDRDRLKAKADGYVDNVHALRDAFGADIVVMITETGDWCGYTFIMDPIGNAFEESAFAVVLRRCATQAGKYSFAHELAHIMSARHDRYVDNVNNAPFPYNHGYVQVKPTSGSPWRTMMAYGTSKTKTTPETNPCGLAAAMIGIPPDSFCPRVLNFSNPYVSIGTDPSGTATEDNHRTLNNTASTVANFRCSLPSAVSVGSDRK